MGKQWKLLLYHLAILLLFFIINHEFFIMHATFLHLDCASMKSSYQKTLIRILILRVILGKSLNLFQSHFLHNKIELNISLIAFV